MWTMSIFLCALPLLLLLVASDPDPISQLCVGDTGSKILVDGLVCKDPSKVTAIDYLSAALTKPINTSNVLGVEVTLVTATEFPGLNTQGLSVARLAFGPNGVNPPHNHPRATEVIYLKEGTLQAGFISDNRLFQTTVHAGELFIFPRGLVHFQRNPSSTNPAVAIATLSSQNPGRTDAALALFTTTPPLSDEVLEKTLQVNQAVVAGLRKNVSTTVTAPGQSALG